MEDWFLAYYALATIVLMTMMGYDKGRAKRRKFRVRESTLMLAGFLGGFAGGLIGMIIFRHKIRKTRFYVAYGLAFAMHAALQLFLLGFIERM
jgi:uncharacterized membrane protein YsdA (DUF1294 family)